MKQTLRSSVSSVIYHGNRFLGPKNSGTRILCYHKVNDEKKDYLTVSTSQFEEQMRILSEEGYRTIGLRDLVRGPEIDLSKSIVITFDDGYRDNFEHAFPILTKFGFSATVFCIAKRVGEPGYLTREEIREMHFAGFEFGSHTLSHPHLPEQSIDRKWWEIFGSKRFLEELLGFKCDWFCYPYGEYDRETVHLVERAGYRGACSNRPGANKRLKPYLLRRTEISGFDSLYDFQKKVAGAFDLLHQSLHWTRGKP